MTQASSVNRRQFLKVSVAAGGGLLLGFHLPACSQAGASRYTIKDSFSQNSWIHIRPDDSVTLMVASSEMGQGVMTSLPMLLAEELDADWSKVRAETAPVHSDFNNPLMGGQTTGGSTAIRGYWEPLRQAGAATRGLLIAAGAKFLNVGVDECHAENGQVIHRATGRRIRYGALLEIAATLTVPSNARLKDPKDYRLIGKSLARLDTPVKVNGSAVYGQDVRLPGMLTAVVARCPIFGGRLKSVDDVAARTVPGVRHVVQIESGVAVVADNFWAAQRGRESLRLVWHPGKNAVLDSVEILQQLRAAAEREGTIVRNEGDSPAAFDQAVRVIDAAYETPYLAHACMEPMNCTAHVRPDRCDVWVPTQAQSGAREAAAMISGLSPAAVHVHTTFLGGGFGRRLRQDFLVEAVAVSKAVGKPVKVLWTREDDIRHGFYRPANYTRLRAALDAQSMPAAWTQRVAGPKSALGGIHVPYAIPNLRIEKIEHDPGIPSGPWRSVGASQNAFSVECFIDELAHAAGQDPLGYRLRLLAASPRHRGVLQLAADKAGWGRALPTGHGRGIAVYHSYAGWVAHVVEVHVTGNHIRVVRVVSAVDCGIAVNPDTVVSQTEGAVIFALTAALKGEITIANGGVAQSNFSDYPLLTMRETPKIDVLLVKSNEPPGGVGEPGVPPLAPAVANAVFAATGKRIRKLPIRL